MNDPRAHPDSYFFIHVMKTAGMTFNRHIKENFAPEELYPGPDDTTGVDYWVIKRLRAAVEQRRRHVKVWRGHFPFFVHSFVPEAATMTLLREPVARTVSLLEQRRALQFPDASLEELYDDPVLRIRELGNHQTKIFSLRPEDDVGAYVAPIEPDRQRLETAKQAVESVDVLGVKRRFDAFLSEVAQRFGWSIGNVASVNVGTTPSASPALRRRIAEDCELDLELYDHVRGLIG